MGKVTSFEQAKRLKELGYDEYVHLDLKNEPKYILTDIDDRTYFYDSWFEDSDINHYINCIGNPKLFRAVAAMRDDSDMWQYFTNGVQFILFDGNDFNEFYIKMNHYRKAPLEELQEHFKIVE